MINLFAGAFFPLVGLLLLHRSAAQSRFYSLNTSEAYTLNSAIPQSCNCVDNQPDSSCKLFRCTCTCDVTAAVCDYECCCDPDCSDAQISRFRELGTCAFEGFQPDSEILCYDSVQLYSVNPVAPLGGESAAREAVGQALCVEKKNVARKGEFFPVADLKSSAIFDQTEGQKTYDYLETADTIFTVDSVYDKNDTIAAFLDSGTSLGFVASGSGLFQLPMTGDSGTCNDNNYVTFENSVDESICNRILEANEGKFVSQCTNSLSVSRYAENLWLAKRPTTVSSIGVTSTDEIVNIAVTNVFFEDFLTGERSNITLQWKTNNCNTTAIRSSDSSPSYSNVDSSCSFSASSTLDTLVASSSICFGMIRSVSYVVYHSTNTLGAIETVTADLVVTDSPMTLSGSSPVVVQQSYSVRFISNDPSDVSAANGNLVRRERSGNPGYLIGKPVLYGFQENSATGVIRGLVDGLSVPSSLTPFQTDFSTKYGTGQCPEEGEEIGYDTVKFGFDYVSGCGISLNRSSLINMCCQGATSCLSSGTVSTITSPSKYSNANGVPFLFNFSDGFVGMYGDADPLNAEQWFGLSLPNPTSSRTWSDRTSTCSNMFTALEVQFLVASTGEKYNPQNKIIAASAAITTADWVMSVPYGDEVTEQVFPLSVIVSFVFKDKEEANGYEPPAPPVLFQVPYDVFYPFLQNSGSTASYSLSIVFLVTTFGLAFSVLS